MNRKQISPKKRFEVFERDGFTCQYCGMRPDEDDVVLNVDHIISIKDGGTNDLENLITSCFGCNIGKGSKSVRKKTKTVEDVQRDLDIAKERLAQIKEMNKKRDTIKKIEKDIFKEKIHWIIEIIGSNYNEKIYYEIQKLKEKNQYKEDVLKEALFIISNKTGGLETTREWLSYFNGICKNLSLTQKEKEILLVYYSDDLFMGRGSGGNSLYNTTKQMILDNADRGVSFHKQVIANLHKIINDNWGETYQTRDEVKKYIKSETFTVYKSGHNFQIMICDTISATKE